MAIMAALAGLMLQQAGSPQPPQVPAFGTTVAPKSAQIRALEGRDPVARRCAQLGDGLAAKVRGEVGDVSIRNDPAIGAVWSATLLIAREPPVAPRMTCNARTFTIANDTFDASTPPDKIPWPYCGWGLSKEERVGVRCGP